MDTKELYTIAAELSEFAKGYRSEKVSVIVSLTEFSVVARLRIHIYDDDGDIFNEGWTVEAISNFNIVKDYIRGKMDEYNANKEAFMNRQKLKERLEELKGEIADIEDKLASL